MSAQAATLDSVLSSLKSLSVASASVVSHAAASSPDSWKEAVSAAVNSATGNFHYTKTLVFKPKTAKSAKAYPIVIVAKLETETNTTALGKEIGQKEMRLAAPELLSEFLGATKDDGELLYTDMSCIFRLTEARDAVSPLSVSSANAAGASQPVLVVLDASLATSTENFAVHAASADKTLFLSGLEIVKYLESTGVDMKVIDFGKLANAAG